MLLTSAGIAFGELFETALAATKLQRATYESCVVGHAKGFAGSPDSTENIVKSAVTACAPARRALSEGLMAAGVSLTKLTSALDALDQQVSQAAAAAILEERASH
jgi:hypothetical protein